MAVLVKSPIGKEFRKGLVTFIKDNARRGYVPEERLSALEGEVAQMKEYLEMTASVSGRLLNAQKRTKPVREQMN
jgi:hypothetical protein